MSKNRNSRVPGNMNYNRPSGGYQKNLYKQQLKAQNIKQPKGLDQKTIRIIAIALGVCCIALVIALTVTMKWTGLLIGLLISLAALGGFWFFLRNKQNEMIKYYKQVSMTEEMYINELRKRNTDVKQLEAARKQWRKVKVDSIFEDPKARKKK